MKRIIIFLFLLFLLALIIYGVSQDPILPKGFIADKIVVYKKKKVLLLQKNGKSIKTYKIALGANPKGHKHFKGDEKTPEGNYIIDYANPKSMAYYSFHISYPNKNDIEFASNNNRSAGGDIMIHGLPNSFKWIGKFHRFINWTDGCIGLTNYEMDELKSAIQIGTPIIIKP